MEFDRSIDLGAFDEEMAAVSRAAHQLVTKGYLARLKERYPTMEHELADTLVESQGDIAVVYYVKGKHVSIELRIQGASPKVLFESVSINPND